MKKSLLFLLTLTSFTSVKSFGQTQYDSYLPTTQVVEQIPFDSSLPPSLVVSTVASTPVGTSASISFSYTSDVACAMYAELRIANIDGSGVITQDYSAPSNYIAGAFSAPLPVAAAAANNGTVSVAVPGSAVLSSNLPAGKTYSWVYKLTPGVNNYNEVGTTFQYTGATIIGSATAVDNLVLVSPPTTSNAGSNVTITVNYTCPAPRLVKFGIAIYNASGFVSDLVGVGVDNLPATSTTPVSLSQEITIPANATPSANLPAGQFYKVDTALFTPGYASYVMGASSNITINPALSNNEYNKNNVRVYPNPAVNSLNISDVSNFRSYEIYNYVGQRVVNSTELSSNGIDVSGLNTGIYFLSLDGKQNIKFIKE